MAGESRLEEELEGWGWAVAGWPLFHAGAGLVALLMGAIGRAEAGRFAVLFGLFLTAGVGGAVFLRRKGVVAGGVAALGSIGAGTAVAVVGIPTDDTFWFIGDAAIHIASGGGLVVALWRATRLRGE